MILKGYCAFGFIEPLTWFLTATIASCFLVVPYFSMWAHAIMA